MTGDNNSQPAPQIYLVSASQFDINALTNAYNLARSDYLVPMQTDADRLAEYIRNYDVDLTHSLAALDGQVIVGLAMLGLRPGRSWFTRLGVLPQYRKHGIGEMLLRGLQAETRRLSCPVSILEVIKGNLPAYHLFRKAGFEEVRELLVLKRTAEPVGDSQPVMVTWLDARQALQLIHQVEERLPWTNDMESFVNAGDAEGLQLELDDGSLGWLVYRRQKKLLSHFVFHTSQGDAAGLATTALTHLYARYPGLESYVENVAVNDPHLPAFFGSGFREEFRRLEMIWHARL